MEANKHHDMVVKRFSQAFKFFILASIVVFGGFVFASTAFAANVTVTDTNAILILPTDSSTYSLAIGDSFDNLAINSTNFVFTIPTGSSITLTSLNSSRELSNTLSLSTTCNTSTSVLTVNNTSGSPEVVTITPGSACVSSNTTTTTTTPPPAVHLYGQSSQSSYAVSSNIPAASQTTTTVTTTTVTNASVSSIPRNLTLNSSGNDVKMLQQFLNAQGFTIAKSGAGSAGNETTFFGMLTKNALIRFQKYYHITPAIGYFGPITRAVIKSL